MACAWPGVRSGSKISTLASSCMARMRISSSLPRPTRYFGSASGRRCSSTPITPTPAVRHSSLQLVDAASGVLTIEGACARSSRGLCARRRRRRAARDRARRSRAPRGRRARTLLPGPPTRAAASSVLRWNGSVGRRRHGSVRWPGTGGSRCAACRSAGRPSGWTPMAATRSRRSSARSTRSSRVSGSLRRWVCTRRRPRKRPRPARMRPISGSVSFEASPTKTCSMSPRRPTRSPTWRSISRDSAHR